MNRIKIQFVFGLFLGGMVTGVFLFYMAPRYTVIKAGDNILKQDSWTGRSWRYVGEQWKPVVGQRVDWEKIDTSLRQALHLPASSVDTQSALKALRNRYPILKDLSDEDLLERIKMVYSRKILCDLYLDRFMKTEKAMENAQ